MTLAQVIDAAIEADRPRLSPHHWKIFNALRVCRTARLGGHLYRCEHCGVHHFVPRSCGNRHCPNCQGHQALEWLEKQAGLLLPVPYFHVVFTLPHALNPIIQQNQRALYNLLFSSVSATLLAFGKNNLGVQLGLTLVLHTWSQTLLDHYHLHCIVSGGGLALDGSGWKQSGRKFLFPVVALGRVFRGKFCEGLQRLYATRRLQFHGHLSELADARAFQGVIRQVAAKRWNAYVKRPFGGPQSVLCYLSRYTHRVAIGNGRLIDLDERAGTVCFRYKIRCGEAAPKHQTMTLELSEFLRRLCLHVLPERFVKIRHYGFLSNRGRQERLARIKTLLGVPEECCGKGEPHPESSRQEERNSASHPQCPYCGHRALVLIQTVLGPIELDRANQRAPP